MIPFLINQESGRIIDQLTQSPKQKDYSIKSKQFILSSRMPGALYLASLLPCAERCARLMVGDRCRRIERHSARDRLLFLLAYGGRSQASGAWHSGQGKPAIPAFPATQVSLVAPIADQLVSAHNKEEQAGRATYIEEKDAGPPEPLR